MSSRKFHMRKQRNSSVASESPGRGRLATTTSCLSSLWESGIFNLEEKEDDEVIETTDVDGEPVVHPKKLLENDPLRHYKLGVIKNLLKNFSLEDTVDYYRSMSASSLKLCPGDFSYDCSMSANKMKERLIHLTGSDQIRLNDAKYVNQLKNKVWHEYQSQLDREEEERVEEERGRLLRLMSHGVITAEQLRDEYQVHTDPTQSAMSHLPPHSRGGLKPSKKTANKATSIGSKSPAAASPRKPSSASQSSTAPPALGNTSPGCLPRLHQPSYTASRQGLHSTSPTLGQHTPRPGDRSYAGCSRTNGSSPGYPVKSTAWTHYEDPRVSQLRYQETVDGLYTVAEQLIPPKLKPTKH